MQCVRAGNGGPVATDSLLDSESDFMGNPVAINISHEETWPLRNLVLRPGRDLSACQWPGDTDETTQHYGTSIDGQIVAIGSLYVAAHDCAPGPDVWQLRGMAVHPDHRGMQLGRQLLDHMIRDARDRLGATTIWCNARIRAVTLYERAGLECVSEPFEIEGVGPHRVMRLALK